MKHIASLKNARGLLQSRLQKSNNTSNIETINAYTTEAIEQYCAAIATVKTTYVTELAELEAFKGCPKAKAKSVEAFKNESADLVNEIGGLFKKMTPLKKENQAKLDLLATSKSAIAQLETRIGTMDKHHSNKALNTAVELLDTLKKVQNEFVEQAGKVHADKAIADYKSTFTSAIEQAMPAFEKDISWTEFFKDIAKAIANFTITVVTFGTKQNFFAYAVSDSALEASSVKAQFGA